MIVGCQCYQISLQLQSDQTDNQLSPKIRILFVKYLVTSKISEFFFQIFEAFSENLEFIQFAMN